MLLDGGRELENIETSLHSDDHHHLHSFGKKTIAVAPGGSLELHGAHGLGRANSWRKLGKTADKVSSSGLAARSHAHDLLRIGSGSDSIELAESEHGDWPDWSVGDEIVIASTDFNMEQAETARITAISNGKISLDKSLEYMHFGEITYGVDERAEVGLLTRNIVVRGADNAGDATMGGHTIAQWGIKAFHVEGVEFRNMGQGGIVGRYPVRAIAVHVRASLTYC